MDAMYGMPRPAKIRLHLRTWPKLAGVVNIAPGLPTVLIEVVAVVAGVVVVFL
jgi:hypothetical protein